MNFYIADTHFGHQNCIRSDSRPFASADEMDRVLISNWNSKVSTADDVWIVGDFCYRSRHDPSWYLKQLSGHKHLIVGNHDSCILGSQAAQQYLESIEKLQYIKDGDADVVMCHYPLAEWSGMLRGSTHIYGHIHANDGAAFQYMRKLENAYNAGCMINANQPVTLLELKENCMNSKTITSVSDEKNLSGIYQPTYLPERCCWGADTAHGVEFGKLDYVAGEVCGDGVLFHYYGRNHLEESSHQHRFEDLLAVVATDPEYFSIKGFESEYSAQERQFLKCFQLALLHIKAQSKPLSRQEQLSIIGMAKRGAE